MLTVTLLLEEAHQIRNILHLLQMSDPPQGHPVTREQLDRIVYCLESAIDQSQSGSLDADSIRLDTPNLIGHTFVAADSILVLRRLNEVWGEKIIVAQRDREALPFDDEIGHIHTEATAAGMSAIRAMVSLIE